MVVSCYEKSTGPFRITSPSLQPASFKYFDAFADKDENIKQDKPGSEWNLTFSETKNITTVDIVIQ